MKKNKIYLIGIILLLAFFFTSVIVSFEMFFQRNAARVEETNLYYLEQDTDRLAEQINIQFQDSQAYLQNVSNIFADSSIEELEEMQTLLDRLSEDAPFDNLYFAYPNGDLYRSSGESHNISDRDYFKNALHGQSGITDVISSRMSGKDAIMCYVPVVKKSKICAVIIGVYHVENLKEILETEFMDERVYSAIIDCEGKVITGSSSQMNQKNILEEMYRDGLITDTELNNVKQDMSAGESGRFSYKGTNGTSLIIYKPLDNNSWYVLQNLPSSVVKSMEDAGKRTTYLLVFGLTCSYIALFLSIYLWIQKRHRELYVENQRVRAIVDASESLIFEWDMKLKKTHWYGDAHKQFHMEDGNSDFVKIIYPGDREKFWSQVEELRNGDDGTVDIRLRKYTGEYVWCNCELAAIRTPSGRMIRTLGIIRNVDEQKKKEIVLTDERDLLTEAIDLLRDSYFIIKMLNLSTGKCRYLKADKEERERVRRLEKDPRGSDYEYDLGKIAAELVHPDYREEFLNCFFIDVLRREAENGNLHQTLIYQRRNSVSGEYKWMQTEFIACKNHEEVMIYVRDITDERIAEEEHKRELQRAYEETSKANKVKTDFMQYISHDFRTPMNAIMGQNQLAHLELQKGNIKKACYYINGVHVSAEYLMRLLSDILDMAYFQEGRLQLEYKNFPVEMLEASCRTFFEYVSKDKMVELQVESGLKGVYVGDYLRIKQMLFNLLENAVKFNRPGGSVFLRFHLEETDHEKTRFHITMRDTGTGMDDDQKARLFEPFGRGRNIVSDTHSGTGMGLAIVKYIIDAMEGEISVESEVGTGTTVELQFELRKAEDVSEDLKGCSIVREEKTVLIVDDNPLNLEVANEMIKSEGFKTVTAESGAEALKILTETPQGGIDILLTDISMPEMDGYELTVRVRAQQRVDIRNMFVIALSAYGYEECSEKVKECGMDAFLNKPFDVDEFIRLVEEK